MKMGWMRASGSSKSSVEVLNLAGNFSTTTLSARILKYKICCFLEKQGPPSGKGLSQSCTCVLPVRIARQCAPQANILMFLHSTNAIFNRKFTVSLIKFTKISASGGKITASRLMIQKVNRSIGIPDLAGGHTR